MPDTVVLPPPCLPPLQQQPSWKPTAPLKRGLRDTRIHKAFTRAIRLEYVSLFLSLSLSCLCLSRSLPLAIPSFLLSVYLSLHFCLSLSLSLSLCLSSSLSICFSLPHILCISPSLFSLTYFFQILSPYIHLAI